MQLYDKPIRRANRLPVEDLRQIARFNRIVKNYLKMCKIEKKTTTGNGNSHRQFQ